MLTALIFLFFLFFFNDTATTEIYTLSLHDALPISAYHRNGWDGADREPVAGQRRFCDPDVSVFLDRVDALRSWARSEEHTSELQSQFHLVCRLLLEKKKKTQNHNKPTTTQRKTTLH